MTPLRMTQSPKIYATPKHQRPGADLTPRDLIPRPRLRHAALPSQSPSTCFAVGRGCRFSHPARGSIIQSPAFAMAGGPVPDRRDAAYAPAPLGEDIKH